MASIKETISTWSKRTALTGTAGVALLGTACLGGSDAKESPTPTLFASVYATPTPSEAAGVPDVKTLTFGGVSFTGIPNSVDPNSVDQANHDVFTNTIGLGSQMAIGEPGGLLVGPDFGSQSNENPYGANPDGWNSMYRSGGSIEPFSPVTQEVLRYEGPAYQNLPEGGFMFASAGQMDVEIGDIKISLPEKANNNYFLIVRGTYGDNAQNTDKNQTAKLTNYKPGHALVQMYEARNETNLAFISEGQFKQMAETSHSGGTNLGDGGASVLTAVFVDVNTKAVTVIEQTLGRNMDASGNWQLAGSNWVTE